MDDDELLRAAVNELGGGQRATQEADHLRLLTRGWLNERAAPDLLPFLGDSVQALSDLIADTQRTIAENATANVSYAFMAHLYQMDLERAKFVLRSYLNARLRKIERYASHILQAPEAAAFLSPHEVTFATRFRTLMNQHYLEAAVRELPESVRGLEDQENEQRKMVLEPDLSTHVICRVDQADLGSIDMGGEALELVQGHIYALPYEPIREFVADGSIELL